MESVIVLRRGLLSLVNRISHTRVFIVKSLYLWLNWLFQVQTMRFDLFDYIHL